MTNAQKYEEVFGFPPDQDMCPTNDCEKCPINNDDDKRYCIRYCINKWWNSEYKELKRDWQYSSESIEPRIVYGPDGQPYRLSMSGGQVVPDTLQGWRYKESEDKNGT